MRFLAALSELLSFSVELLGFLTEPFVLWGSSGVSSPSIRGA